jgi:8-oxo-dGTP pyrophosphatase MutT (NUDIX family)
MGGGGDAREEAAGGVVARWAQNTPLFLLIFDGHGNWGFPKGRLLRDETMLEAARREICEETGVCQLRLREDLGEERWTVARRGTPREKSCRFYLFETDDVALTPQAAEGISECRWAVADEADQLLTFDQQRDVLRRASASLANQSGTTAG